jgi:predicted ester cyclase
MTGDSALSSIEANKARIHEFYRRSHTGDLSVYDEMFSADFVSHGSAAMQDLVGAEAFKQAYIMYTTAFPDFYTSIDHIVAEGDYVMVRGLASGTHQGSFMGLPPTGKRLEWTGFALYRFNDAGLICERWQDFDGLKLMGELGIIPNLYAPG